MEERESPNGYHFYSAYRDCPWKWYIKYIEGIKPRYIAAPLVVGKVIHKAKEAFYRNRMNPSSAEILQIAHDTLAETLSRETIDGSPTEVYDKVESLLGTWYETWADHDRQVIEVLEVEQEYEIEFGPEEETFLFTIRPDRVLRNKEEDTCDVYDTKTTGYSIKRAYQAVDMEDQITAYIWAIKKVHPEWKVDSAIIDILYRKGKVAKAERHGPLYRSSLDLKRFELSMYGTILEISQKVQNLSSYPRELLFPRHGRLCGVYGCEYSELCRTSLKEGEIPLGFIRDPWKLQEEADNGR